MMDKNTPTTPVINIVQTINERENHYNQYQQLCSIIKRGNKVQYHKKQLGKQNYCWTNELRMWVWEKPINYEGKDVGWRVYVNNHKGIYFEVTENCTESEAILLFFDYLKSINCAFYIDRSGSIPTEDLIKFKEEWDKVNAVAYSPLIMPEVGNKVRITRKDMGQEFNKRKNKDGKITKIDGGYYSIRLTKTPRYTVELYIGEFVKV